MNKKNLLFSLIIVATGIMLHINASAQQTYSNENSTIQENTTNILVPTAFSPNNDGINDEFKLANVKNEELLDFRVFNRWGTILFSTKDIHKGWDGHYKGNLQDIGTYGYLIRIKLADGNEEVYRGTVTLVK